MYEKPVFGVCEQQRPRPACTSAQSDQHLCYSLIAKNHTLTCYSSLDKQRICVSRQLKSSKKQLKLNVCVPKSNSVDQYAITCDVIGYHLVHFVSICVIYKCQSGIDFFLLASAQYHSNFMNKISQPIKYLSGKTLQNGCKQLMSTRQ